MANDRDREVLSRLMQAYDESFGERCSDLAVQVLATYREEIEARYAGVVEALENYITHQSEVRESCKPKCDVYVQARVALAKIGRG